MSIRENISVLYQDYQKEVEDIGVEETDKAKRGQRDTGKKHEGTKTSILFPV